MIKFCKYCLKDKEIDSFPFDKRHRDGRFSYCRECVSLVSKITYAKNREKRLEQMRAWKKANADQRRTYHREWMEKNPEKIKGYEDARTVKYPRRATFYNWKKSFGISQEDYAALFAQQKGLCPICHWKLRSGRGQKSAHLDHDHDTGKVRGIICRECNVGLGHFKDSLRLLENAVQYLRSFTPDSEIVSSA